MAVLFLVGCSGQTDHSESTKLSKQEIEDNEMLERIRNHSIEIYGIRYFERKFKGEITINKYDISFIGYPDNLDNLSRQENDDGSIRIKAETIVKNDFFTTETPVKIDYTYKNGVVSAEVEESEPVIKPIIPFDQKMFFDPDRRLALKYSYEVEANNRVGFEIITEEIPLTEENIESIVSGFDTEIPGDSFGGHRGDFSVNSTMMFTLKNGDRYSCVVSTEYKPINPSRYNYDKRDKKPVWDIDLGPLVKKIENDKNN